MFADSNELVAYVEAELKKAVPRGWSWRRLTPEELLWSVEKKDVPPDEWQDQDYKIFVFPSSRFLAITYGNKDFGPLSLEHSLMDSKLISVHALQLFKLHELLRHVFENCPPNEWGYS